MSRNQNLREKYLDGEKLFRKYFEMGEGRTILLLTEWAILDGMKSSQGNEPTPMGVWKAMWRWASMKENRDLAWEIYKEHTGNDNFNVWKTDMIKIKIPTAWQHKSQVKREKFLRENGWISDGSKS
jgi:hypothetical protein